MFFTAAILLLFTELVNGYLSVKQSSKRSFKLFDQSDVVETRNVKILNNGMKLKKLPGTDLAVSEICLGTMTYGEQLGREDSYKQLDVATKEYGINFIDTAESYPVPSAPSTTGLSEQFIGEWLKKQKKGFRSEVVVSTKICGFSNEITWCRKDGSGTNLSKKQIKEAVNGQLKRLGTDYIDLLQFHWPERYIPLFGAGEYNYNLERKKEEMVPIVEQLEAVAELIKDGKVRHFGLSNETPMGLMSFLLTAEALNLPKPCVTQNAFNLLEKNDFESGLLEICSKNNYNVGLLAYSPLAGGALTGKYQNLKAVSNESRMKKFVGYQYRYIAPPAQTAVQEYLEVANEYAIPLGPLSLAYCYSRPFVTSTIIGATSEAQLKENVMALNLLPFSKDLEHKFNKVFNRHRDPTKGTFDAIDPNLDYVDPATLPWGAKDEDVDPELDLLINQREDL